MPILPAPVRRTLSDAVAACRDGQARSSMIAAQLARTARLGGVAAGALTPEVAVLECGSGRNASGLFSEFAAVLGLLDHYERRQRFYAGVRVHFGGGLYLDPPFGDNWWEYYFDPLDIATSDGPSRVVSRHYHDCCANRVERTMSRVRGAALIDRYVGLKPVVRRIVDCYLAEHWTAGIIGVHYRGTDKAIDARRVPYDEVESIVRDNIRATATAHSRIFLATDEQPFVDFMRARFPEQLLVREMFRSADGRPTDVVNADGNYQKGLDAVVDCLLLSRTHFLVRTASNLSLCATLFNPRLPNLLMNPER